jgi:hypothetical protein
MQSSTVIGRSTPPSGNSVCGFLDTAWGAQTALEHHLSDQHQETIPSLNSASTLLVFIARFLYLVARVAQGLTRDFDCLIDLLRELECEGHPTD